MKQFQFKALMIAVMIDRLGDLSELFESEEEIEEIVSSQIARIRTECNDDPTAEIYLEAENIWFYTI